MRDFSWNYFIMTGDVESYLLYKEIDDCGEDECAETELPGMEGPQADLVH